MTPIEALVLAVGGNAILLAAVAFLIKSLVSQWLARELKQHETDLSRASAAAAEKLKHQFSLVAHEHKVRFSRLHDKQAVVLEDIYAKLLDFEEASAVLTLASNDTSEDLLEFALRKAEDAGRELAHYVRRHEIYLPDALSRKIHALLDRVTSMLSDCSFNLLSKKLVNDGKPDLFPEAKDAWTNVHRYLEDEGPNLRRALEVDFRRLLGSEAN